jgi:hypothetical protein
MENWVPEAPLTGVNTVMSSIDEMVRQVGVVVGQANSVLFVLPATAPSVPR